MLRRAVGRESLLGGQGLRTLALVSFLAPVWPRMDVGSLPDIESHRDLHIWIIEVRARPVSSVGATEWVRSPELGFSGPPLRVPPTPEGGGGRRGGAVS